MRLGGRLRHRGRLLYRCPGSKAERRTAHRVRHFQSGRPFYSGAMTDCNEAIRPVHDRMPVIVMPDEYDRCLNGSFEDLLGFQFRCFPDDLIEMNRTDELWSRTSKVAKDQAMAT